MKYIVFGIWYIAILFLVPSFVYARYTPNDAFQEKYAQFERSLNSFKDQEKKEKVLKADEVLYQINQDVCFRFEEDLNKLAAIMEEVRAREGVLETRVAYGNVNTKIEQADYQINFAAEALAYQKAQSYTPYSVSENNIKNSFLGSKNRLESDLNILANKILAAKQQVKVVINE